MNIESVDWSRLKDAYGPAEDCPRLLRALTSQDEDERQNAVNELLFSKAYHQYDVYSVTPYVIRYAIRLLRDGTSLELPAGSYTLGQELIHFCRACAEANFPNEEIADQIFHALLEGKDAYSQWCRMTSTRRMGDAVWLLKWCAVQPPGKDDRVVEAQGPPPPFSG